MQDTGYTVTSLIDHLTGAGNPPVALHAPDGSRLLVLPAGGRLLGLFPPEAGENFLWTNPALATAESARAYFARDGWPNPGGDRTWLAPEIELFIGDLARPGESYAVPRALDPGNWTLASATNAELCLTQATRLRLQRTGRDLETRMTKSFRPATNPLAGTVPATAGLRYAGYTQVTTLELEPVADTAIRLGIWNLLQLPQPGEMLIPTRVFSRPQIVFGTPAPDTLTAEPGLVRWHMTNTGVDAKIALKADALTGRAGYLRQTATPGICDLVVREFTLDLAGEYVDALWAPPHETGWGFQACCVCSGNERFNELEYHAPAVAAATGRNHCRDESHVWAFRGSTAAVAEAAKALLGADVEGRNCRP